MQLLKRLMCEVEDASPVGRLLDADVIGLDGEKLSRTDVGLPVRRCLLCGEEAPLCARSRAHSAEALFARAEGDHSRGFVGTLCAPGWTKRAAGAAVRGGGDCPSPVWWTARTAARTGTWTSLHSWTARRCCLPTLKIARAREYACTAAARRRCSRRCSGAARARSGRCSRRRAA